MTLRVIKLPDIGEGVAEAEIVEWLVKPGDLVVEDQIIAAAMTDKATVEIPTPFPGKIVELGGDIGSVMAVGSMLVSIETQREGETESNFQAESEPSPPATPPKPAPKQRESTKSELATTVPGRDKAVPSLTANPEPRPVASATKPLASPATRKLAHDRGIELQFVTGSGPGGRITSKDVENHQARSAGEIQPRRLKKSGTEQIKIVGLRRRIADNMAESTRRLAHFTYVEEVDVTALEELRARLNTKFADRAKLTILPFAMRALVLALPEFPQMNMLYDDDAQAVVRHEAVNIGIATQTPAGLMVPVVFHCEAQSLWEMSAEVKRLAEAARAGRAARDELSGSTITITSLGDLGGISTTPVINRPEVAIVGINKIAIRPVWIDGQFAPRKMMNLSCSFDHRVIDGYDAALFVRRLKESLEVPGLLLLEQ